MFGHLNAGQRRVEKYVRSCHTHTTLMASASSTPSMLKSVIGMTAVVLIVTFVASAITYSTIKEIEARKKAKK